MKYTLLSLLIVLFSCHNAFSQQGKLVEGALTKEAMIMDLDEYADGIAKNHIDPFTVIKKQDFYDKIDDLQQSAHNLDIDQLWVKWLQINALLGDNHTNIQNITRDMLPFYFQWYAEGIYIIATNDDNRKYYHSKIIAINDIPIEEVAKRVTSILPDADMANVKKETPYYITQPVVLHGLGIAPDRNSITYTLLTPTNETVKISPKAIDKRDANQITGFKKDHFLRTSVSGKYWFKYIDSIKCVYFSYQSCIDNGNFQHIIDELQKAIEEKEPKKIVIDMRYNTGGNSNLLQPFIDYLSRSYLNKKGSINVLIGRLTFSSGVITAVHLKRQTNATFIGEETSGNVDHFGESKFFTLKETKLKVYYSTKHFTSYEKYPGAFQPDVKIVETFAEYDKDIDSVVDYALAH